MSDFVDIFRERVQEIEAYLDLLEAIEQQVQEGIPYIGKTGRAITVQQQRILYSSVYLQLYNLVESTITRCIDAISSAIVRQGVCLPGDLSLELRREWVRFMARTHTELNFEKRLDAVLTLCEHMIQTLPIAEFKLDKGGGGSWDDLAIQDISRRLGLQLTLSLDVLRGVKQPFRDDKGPLVLIKSLRNDLAHGSLSFAECGEGVTVTELRDLAEKTIKYLREVVSAFQGAIDTYQFLLPERRPSRNQDHLQGGSHS